MADNLVELGKIYDSGKEDIKAIRRSRYNRYMRIKAKLALIKQEIMDLREVPDKVPLQVIIIDSDDSFETGTPSGSERASSSRVSFASQPVQTPLAPGPPPVPLLQNQAPPQSQPDPVSKWQVQAPPKKN